MAGRTAGTDNYRPLNVRDALSYLDQVKHQFTKKPEVYNKFLDVMKEFKSQTIDTPGVIERVSNLFRGHPSLIQGFNTFLPPGYRIECKTGVDGGSIVVTTPTGTITTVEGSFTSSQLQGVRKKESERVSPARDVKPATSTSNTAAVASSSTAPVTVKQSPASTPAASTAPAQKPIVTPTAQPAVTTPQAASTIAAASAAASGAGNAAAGASAAGAAAWPKHGSSVEFNHAITFVNKIKNRFKGDAETYKQFLEILQTYQRDTRDIDEVYAQVSKLFANAPELIKEFKQFLPESHGGPPETSSNFSSLLNTTNSENAGKRNTATSHPSGSKKRKGADPKGASKNKKTKADTPSADEPDVPLLVPGSAQPQTLASPEEVAFFDKVKKHIDDKVTYHEFLKLINLFSQDMIDTRTLVERADSFIGNAGEIWHTFKKMVLVDEAGNPGPNPEVNQRGYGFGGMIAVDGAVVENVPMLERVKPDLSGNKVKTYGPSYRKLPKTEVNLTCSGRDAMCWEVLNDEWVSHPTWAAEDAAPFMAHKKNAYEEALHKSEEERHEYDYHIEANLRTIALLEPLNNKIQTMDPEERSRFNLKQGLGGQSKSIYQRIMKKVYGKELGHDVVRAIHDNPSVALPIVLERLKSKDEEWKKAQREWNRVWREQDAKNFYKALDHQGVILKQNDKKTISAKSLLAEIELRRKEQNHLRQNILNSKDSNHLRYRPQFEFEFKDQEVLKDVIKLVITYLDRVNNQLSTSDKERIERQLRDFVPLLWMFDKDEFDLEFGDAERPVDNDDLLDGASEGTDNVSEEGDGDISMAEEDESNLGLPSRLNNGNGKKNKGGIGAGDLRKKLLKQVGEKGRDRENTQTPAPEDNRSMEGTPMTEGERGETPLPVPDDPEAVAMAVEADKAGADASEQTWVNVEEKEETEEENNLKPNGNGHSKEDDKEAKEDPRKSMRKGSFYANGHFYVLVRLIQLLYSRLLTCKNIAEDLSKAEKKPINPIAIKLGLAEPETNNFGVEAGENPAQHYYGHLLNMAEKLFENEVDSNTFEETLRIMFGTKAYMMFTLDRVVAAIVKQTQTVLGDMKSQELFALLERDRKSQNHSTRRQLAYRHSAENIVGPDEDMFRFQTFPYSDVITVKIIGKHDPTNEDDETAAERWRGYVDSYVLTHSTEGLPHRVDEPLLKRNLADLTDDAEQFDRVDGLSCRIAVGSYKMFAVEDTEDYFHHRRTPSNVDAEADEAKTTSAKKRLEEFVGKKIGITA